MIDQQPIIPHQPWYSSEVQVRAVLAIAAQLVSILLRMIGRYTELSITTDMVDAIMADLSQVVAVVFGGLAIVKRQQSTIAPLTLTAGTAALKSMENPSILDTDPTKIQKGEPNAGK